MTMAPAETADLEIRARRVHERSRDTLATILWRIEKLTGEVTALNRYEPFEDKPDADRLWADWHRAQRIEKNDALALWERVRDLRVAAGERVWEPGHFEKGDRVRSSTGWATVVRVNPKTLTVRADATPTATNTLSYTKITGRARPGEETP